MLAACALLTAACPRPTTPAASTRPTRASAGPENSADGPPARPQPQGVVLGALLDLKRRHLLGRWAKAPGWDLFPDRLWLRRSTLLIAGGMGPPDAKARCAGVELFHLATWRELAHVRLAQPETYAVDPLLGYAIEPAGRRLRVHALGNTVAYPLPHLDPFADEICDVVAVPGHGAVLTFYGDAGPRFVPWRGSQVVLQPRAQPTQRLRGAAVADDGRWLVLSSGAGLDAWALTTGKLTSWPLKAADDGNPPALIGFVSRSHLLAFRHDAKVRVWDLGRRRVRAAGKHERPPLPCNGRVPRAWFEAVGRVTDHACLDERQLVLVGGHNVDRRRGSVIRGQLLMRRDVQLLTLPWPFGSVQLVPGGEWPRVLVGSATQQQALLLDHRGHVLQRFARPCAAARAPAGATPGCHATVFAVDRDTAVVHYARGQLALVSLATGEELRSRSGVLWATVAGKRLLFGSPYTTLRCELLPGGASCGQVRQALPAAGPADGYRTDVALALSPAGAALIASDDDHPPRLLRLDGTRPPRVLRHPQRDQTVTRAFFAPDGALALLLSGRNHRSAVDAVLEQDGALRWQDTTASGLLRRVGDVLLSGTVLRDAHGAAVAQLLGLYPRAWRTTGPGRHWVVSSLHGQDGWGLTPSPNAPGDVTRTLVLHRVQLP